MSSPDLPFSEAAHRNKEPILEVLTRWLPRDADVLEVASGTGQHAAHFAAERPGWRWQPSEASYELLAVIARRCAGLANVGAPVALDVLAPEPVPALGRFDAVLCVNMLHISPWPTCRALMHCASRHLVAGGALVLYGPYVVDGTPTAPSNLAFDADLRARNPAWGLRRLADVEDEAGRCGLTLVERVAMPANNLMLALRAVPPRST